MRSHVAANRRHGCSGRTCTQPRGAAQPAVLEAGIQEQACDAGRARAARLPQLGPHVALRGGLHGQRRAQPCGSYVVPQLPQLCLSQRHTLQQAGPHAAAPTIGAGGRHELAHLQALVSAPVLLRKELCELLPQRGGVGAEQEIPFSCVRRAGVTAAPGSVQGPAPGRARL